MNFYNPLIESAKKQIPNLLLEIEESEDWRSGNLDHRFKLRNSLQLKLKNKFPNENFDEILDLKKLPQFKHGFVSISHSPKVGAFAISSRQLGIDIEVESRVQASIVERICQKSELVLTDKMAALWSAKEALFKAHRNLKLISDTQILEWNLSQDGIFTFADLQFIGWVYLTQGVTVALAIKKSST